MLRLMVAPDFAAGYAALRARYESAARDTAAPRPELPFSLDSGDGDTLSALESVRGTLAGCLTIVFGIGAIIVASVTVRAPWILSSIGLALVALVVWSTTYLRKKRLGDAWRRESTVWPAALVMAHDSLWRAGQSVMPGAVLVDFGAEGTVPDPDRLVALAETLYDLVDKPSPSRQEQTVIDWLQREMERARFGRLRVPREIAGRDGCWLVSLRLDRNAMPEGHLDRRFWFVVARPDREESAELMPHEYESGD